jgi:hypothetical protein
MINDPIHKCPVKSDIEPGFLGFNPLMFKNFVTFGLKLPIEGAVSDELSISRVLSFDLCHDKPNGSLKMIRYHMDIPTEVSTKKEILIPLDIWEENQKCCISRRRSYR